MKTGSLGELITISIFILIIAYITTTWFTSPNIEEIYEYYHKKLVVNMSVFQYDHNVRKFIWTISIAGIIVFFWKGFTKNIVGNLGVVLLFFVAKPWIDLHNINQVGFDPSFSWIKYIILVLLAFFCYAFALGVRSKSN